MKNGVFYKLRRKMQVFLYDVLGAERVSKLYFRLRFGYKLDLKNPKTLNQKIQWLKLYYCPSNDLALKCADKYAVREYLSEKGYGEYLINLLGVYDRAEDITWDKLPDKFVIKCNHGCGYNIICKDKKEFDIKKAVKTLNRWLKQDFGKYNAEPHYSKIPRKILIEEYLGELADYKFFCFNGKCDFYYISKNMGTENATMACFDDNGLAPFRRADYKTLLNPVIPPCIDQMKSLAENVCKDFPFVRVDLYYTCGKIYFGELTFTAGGGLMLIEPTEYDVKLGEKLDISLLKSKKNVKNR